MNQKEAITIRSVHLHDVPEIRNVYRPYVENTAITFEYTVPSEEEFTKRILNTLQGYPYLVAEINGKVVGYAYAGPLKTRAAYDRSTELSIYVSMEHRQSGIGRKLYEELQLKLKEQGMLNFYACIGYPIQEDEYLTKDSEKFHEKMGFQKVAHFHRCGYKFGRWYDMIWMEKLLTEAMSH